MKTLTSAPLLLAATALAGSLFLAFDANAQVLPSAARAARHYNTVSASLNAMNYFGDLAPKPAFTSLRLGSTRPNLAFSISHRFAPRLTGRVSLGYGRISGDDNKAADEKDTEAVYRYNRNLRFRNDIVELAAVGMLDLFENRGSYLKRRELVPYLFAGVGFFYHNPKAPNEKGKYTALQPLGTEGQTIGVKDKYSRAQISIPFGIGLNYRLNRQMNIGYEIGWRKTFTDYLDDVSGKYVDRDKLSGDAKFLSDPSNQDLKKPGNPGFRQFRGAYGVKNSQRGTTNENDWYIVSGFNIQYILIPTSKSPKFR
jgi:Domain of unknown function (DUF6089)